MPPTAIAFSGDRHRTHTDSTVNKEQYVVVEYTVYSGYEEGTVISPEFSYKEALEWITAQNFPQDGKKRELEFACVF